MDSAGPSNSNKCKIINDTAYVIEHPHVNVDCDDDGNSSNDDAQISTTEIMRQRKRSSSNSKHRANKSFPSTIDSHANSSDLNASGNSLRKQFAFIRRSPSPSPYERSNMHTRRQISRLLSVGLSPGYAQYQKALLEVPLPRDYGEASSDDLSSEWDSDVPETQRATKVNDSNRFSTSDQLYYNNI